MFFTLPKSSRPAHEGVANESNIRMYTPRVCQRHLCHACRAVGNKTTSVALCVSTAESILHNNMFAFCIRFTTFHSSRPLYNISQFTTAYTGAGSPHKSAPAGLAH